MTSNHHTCPRRMQDIGPWERTENLDTWNSGRGWNTPRDRQCSFCGSMHPDDFMQHVREGAEVGPTDKSYKAYLSNPSGKFYFQHLSEDQMREFVELLKEQRMVIGYPGHFYTRPFFISYGPPPANDAGG